MRVVAIVVLSTAVLSVAPRSRAGRAMFVLSALGAAMVLLLLDGPVAHWISMAIGVPSIASVAWLGDIALTRGFDLPLFEPRERRTLIVTMAVASLILYPSALGFVNADIYRLGFTPIAPLAIAAAGIALAVHRRFRLAILALLVLAALDAKVLVSNNVFDAIVDPVGGVCAVGWSLVQIAKSVSARTLMRSRAGAFDAESGSGSTGGRSAAPGTAR